MMNLLKKNLAFLLAGVLCLSLTACGGSDDTADEAAGDDWRSSGMVVGSGTITHEGEGSVYVLVTVDENWAAFYRDEPEHILFDSVSFPMVIPDAQKYFDGIYFDDISGDGESDVCIDFVYAPDDILSLVWIWDPVERYVYREDLSILPTDGGDISEYVGLWEYVDEDVWIRIYEDETWECLDAQGNAFQFGTLSVDSTGITFYSDDYDETPRFDRTASGSLYDAENDGTLVLVYDNPFNNIDISEYVGLWKYEDINLWLRIYEDGTWDFFNDQEDVIYSGTLQVDETGITLYFDGTDDVLQLDCSMSDCLIDCEDGSVLVPADSIQSQMPYFTRNGFEINAEVDAGTYLLENGVCSYYNLGKNYTVGDCYWEVIKNYDMTHDGIREIEFDAVCYVPSSSLGTFDQEFIISSHSALYDYYTGKWFNTDNDHTEKNHTERIDNHYVNTLEWNGQSYEVEYSYSTEAEFYVADWYMVYTVSYMVYLPEGYDGLLFVAEPEAMTYEEHMEWSDPTADYYLTEENSMDLFFSICD